MIYNCLKHTVTGVMNQLHSSPSQPAAYRQCSCHDWLMRGINILPLICCCGSDILPLIQSGSWTCCVQHSSSLNQRWASRGWTQTRSWHSRAASSGFPPFCCKHSVVAGRAAAIAADLRLLHSVALGAVGEIIWFETACANKQSQGISIVFLIDE